MNSPPLSTCFLIQTEIPPLSIDGRFNATYIIYELYRRTLRRVHESSVTLYINVASEVASKKDIFGAQREFGEGFSYPYWSFKGVKSWLGTSTDAWRIPQLSAYMSGAIRRSELTMGRNLNNNL
ncbi:hypothetical protein EYZ11_009149 [Aspergillus tanneri]|uniref:Uncharacterized protein n=1 Tax=Aspergillus tanneri TaxID=1220188 RepID=A0A4S3JE32_9EURO|nr:hypothetical protein EYZ11_009149 [Aspergillus tanneri]